MAVPASTEHWCGESPVSQCTGTVTESLPISQGHISQAHSVLAAQPDVETHARPFLIEGVKGNRPRACNHTNVLPTCVDTVSLVASNVSHSIQMLWVEADPAVTGHCT